MGIAKYNMPTDFCIAYSHCLLQLTDPNAITCGFFNFQKIIIPMTHCSNYLILMIANYC